MCIVYYIIKVRKRVSIEVDEPFLKGSPFVYF